MQDQYERIADRIVQDTDQWMRRKENRGFFPYEQLRDQIRDALRAQAAHEVELKYRKELWLNHGHGWALYGDDGEMQCSKCTPVCDYLRAPLAVVEHIAQHARLIRAADAVTLVDELRRTLKFFVRISITMGFRIPPERRTNLEKILGDIVIESL